jgi:hypothetical protein
MINQQELQSLATDASEAKRLTKEGIDWLQEAQLSSTGVTAGLRRAAYTCSDIEAAAPLRPCVGVYGTSQAGKSYLLSYLATTANKPLTAQFGPFELDFLKQLNGEGGAETTGLVTRFTTLNPPEAMRGDDKFLQVKLRILSEVDLISIFLNAFVLDLEHDDRDDEKITATRNNITKKLKELSEKRVQANVKMPISEAAVFKLEQYYKKNLEREHPDRNAIRESGFWENAIELLPRLERFRRVEVISLLWADNKDFTSLFERLSEQLEQLDHADWLMCDIAALADRKHDSQPDADWVRSPNSILHVKALQKLSEAPGNKKIKVRNSEKRRHEVEFTVLAALTAELILPLKYTSDPVFNNIDFLDFPGARARKQTANSKDGQDTLPAMITNYRRGKVAYLFDRYISNFEIPGLMLCVGPGNVDATSIAPVIDDWIIATHGQTPEEREALTQNTFFIILTKFDQLFSADRGRLISQERWRERLKASLIEPFADRNPKSDWVKRWTPKSKFKNLFWFRNPNADQSQLLEYGNNKETAEQQRELSIREDKKVTISELKNEFLETPEVGDHFDDPEKAWDAAWTLNDGGRGRLFESLGNSIGKDKFFVKSQQLKKILAEEVQSALRVLKPFHRADNYDEARLKKEKFYESIEDSIINLADDERLGEFIRFLLIDSGTVSSVFTLTKGKRERETGARGRGRGLFRERIKGASGIHSTAADSELEAQFVDDLLSMWRKECWEKLYGDGKSSPVCKYLRLRTDDQGKQLVSALLDEFKLAADRELRKVIYYCIRNNYQFTEEDKQDRVRAAEITAVFNEFIARGGRLTDGHKFDLDVSGGVERKIVSPSDDPVSETLTIGETETPIGHQIYQEWMDNLKDSIIENAVCEVGLSTKTDLQLNSRLGLIISKLEIINQRLSKGNR